MTLLHYIQLVTAISFSLAVGHYGVKILRWSYKKWKKFDSVMDFVPDIATNHLPHIYHAQVQQGRVLVQIADKLGVEATIDENDPPPIRFIKDSE